MLYLTSSWINGRMDEGMLLWLLLTLQHLMLGGSLWLIVNSCNCINLGDFYWLCNNSLSTILCIPKSTEMMTQLYVLRNSKKLRILQKNGREKFQILRQHLTTLIEMDLEKSISMNFAIGLSNNHSSITMQKTQIRKNQVK